MRTSDIAYVPQGTNNIKPLPPLEKMTLGQIVKNYLVNCVKSYGKVSECMKCESKCPYGIEAIKLATGNIGVTDKRAVPYEGSMLQKARAENDLKRKAAEKLMSLTSEMKEIEKEKEEIKQKIEEKRKRGGYRRDPEGWYEESLKSEDQIAWVMEKFDLSRTQAKKKIYNYKYLHPNEAKHAESASQPASAAEIPKPVEEVKDSVVEEETLSSPEVTPEKKAKQAVLDDIYMAKAMERKLESLMNRQEECEAKLKEYREEYEQKIKPYQEEIAKLKEQVDTLCRTMDIFKTI